MMMPDARCTRCQNIDFLNKIDALRVSYGPSRIFLFRLIKFDGLEHI